MRLSVLIGEKPMKILTHCATKLAGPENRLILGVTALASQPFIDYYNNKGVIPHYLTIGFAYLCYLYMNIHYENNVYICKLSKKEFLIKDEMKYLTYFTSHTLNDFISDSSIWGMDLSKFKSFKETVILYVKLINEGREIING